MAKAPELTPDLIRKFREANGFSQQELAHLLGVGLATVSRWERGTPPMGTASMILRTVIFAPNDGLLSRSLSPGYALYNLLKEVFEPDDLAE